MSTKTTPTVEKIGKYDVQAVLGQGGMGIVYKAVDSKIGRPVAIKMMTGAYAENPDLLKRFYREAQASGMLQHRNIVTIYDLGDENGSPYMVMEFISGQSLEDMIQAHKRLTMVEKLDYMVQICAGLEYAHKHGIVHRDIKPGNIMVLADGTVKIVDFGIARVQDNSMTKTGQIVGTINYMSPEQFNGHVVDGRSDIFSAGVLFFELLTSALPFEGAETPSVILKILNEDPPPLINYIQGFPPELETILHKALAKDREERYASCADFAFELEKVLEALKKDMVVEYVVQAKDALGKSELNKAKDLLLQVLKVDTKNLDANDLMKDVQSRLAAMQRGEQMKQLRAAAEDALAARNFEDALSCIEQAQKLDKNNAELAQMFKLATQAKQKKEQQQRLLRKAQDLRDDGEFESALAKAEEALALDPNDTSAKDLRAAIAAELEKARKEKELSGLLEQARREIAQRHFTAALQRVRQAESLSTGLTQSGSLRSLLKASREQEIARLDVDAAAIEIEVTLYTTGVKAALAKAEEALAKHHGDSTLVEIRAHAAEFSEAAGIGDSAKVLAHLESLLKAEKFAPAIAMLTRAMGAAPDPSFQSALDDAKTRAAEFARQAESAATVAQKMLAQKKVDEAVELLESKPEYYPRNQVFAKVLAQGRAEQDKVGSIESAALEARAMAQKNDVVGAHKIAKSLLQANPASAIAQQLLKELEAKRGLVAKDTVEKAIRDAKALVLARQTAAANRTLQSVADYLPHVPAALKTAYDQAKKEAASGAQAAEGDDSKTIVHGSAGRAQSTGGGAAAMPALDRTPEKTIVSPVPAAATPFPTKQVAAAVLAVVLAVAGFFGYKKFFAPPPVDSYVQVDAVPFATISGIVTTDGKRTVDLTADEKQTPARIPLPAGEYKITFTHPDGTTAVETVKVSPTSPGSVTHVMESLSPNEIVRTSN